MVFNFGQATPAAPVGGEPTPANKPPAPSGAPATAGFSFGGGAAPNTSNAPPQNTAAATTATGASTPAGGPTFQFGSSTGTATQVPAQTTQTPAAAAPATTTTIAPPPSTGGSATTTTPAAGSTFAFGGSAGAPSTTPAPGLTGNALIKISAFNDVFPNLQTWSKLRRLIFELSGPSDEARWAGQELLHFLSCQTSRDSIGKSLSKPEILRLTPPDGTVRQNLQSKPVVMLDGTTEAPLSQPMLQDVLNLANDLRVSEIHAITLYRQANDASTRSLIASEGGSLIDKALSYVEGNELKRPKGFNTITKAARELYFLERSTILKSLRHLLQSRIGGNRVILEASDGIIQSGLVPNLVSLIRDWTARISEFEKHLSNQRDGQTNMSLPVNLQLPRKAEQPGFEKVHLVYAQQERQMAVECLFYLAYHTQLTGDEIVSIVDLIKDLTNGVNGISGLTKFNPFSDVPSPHEQTASNANGWATPFTSPFTPAVSPLKEKDVLSWQKELISKTWDRGAPHLLNCVAPLVLAAICAMDARQELMDRDLHGPNSFGVVRLECFVYWFKLESDCANIVFFERELIGKQTTSSRGAYDRSAECIAFKIVQRRTPRLEARGYFRPTCCIICTPAAIGSPALVDVSASECPFAFDRYTWRLNGLLGISPCTQVIHVCKAYPITSFAASKQSFGRRPRKL